MKLHTIPLSSNSHAVIAVVKHLKVEDKVEIINAAGKTRTPEFIAMNPCHVCPTLQLDDGTAIWETCSLLRFMCNYFEGGEALYPKDEILRAKLDMVMDWRNTTFYSPMVPIAYCIYGVPCDDEEAKKSFAKISSEHFPLILGTFLKDTPFCFNDKPTIADLALGLAFVLFKGRNKYWEKVPEEIKDYYKRVRESFPEAEEYFALLDDKATSYDGPGSDAEP